MKDTPVEILAEGKYARFVRQGRWEFVQRKNLTGIVVLVPITDDNQIVLVEQFRVPTGARVIELPAGLAGDIPGQEDEDLTLAAARELEEETGYRAQQLKRLLAGPPSPGISNEVVTFFLATGLERVGPGGGDASEDIQVHHVPTKEFENWLTQQDAAGKLIDPKVLVAQFYAARLD